MNYSELKNFVLQLLNRYSIAGEKTPLSYNDQADIVARIPALTRDAMQYIATSTRRMRTLAPLVSPERQGAWLIYHLPDDCYQICGGLLRMDTGGDITRYRGYRLAGDRQLLIPASEEGQYMLEYFRYPTPLPMDPQDSDSIDCPPEAQQAVAYYVAAHLAMEDSNYLHTALYHDFEMKLLRLQEGLTVQCDVVEDLYG